MTVRENEFVSGKDGWVPISCRHTTCQNHPGPIDPRISLLLINQHAGDKPSCSVSCEENVSSLPLRNRDL